LICCVETRWPTYMQVTIRQFQGRLRLHHTSLWLGIIIGQLVEQYLVDLVGLLASLQFVQHLIQVCKRNIILTTKLNYRHIVVIVLLNVQVSWIHWQFKLIECFLESCFSGCHF